jgi:hypothetical protein
LYLRNAPANAPTARNKNSSMPLIIVSSSYRFEWSL